MAIGALVAPGAILPVLKEPLSAAMLWVMLSAFRQETVWPTFTVPGFGEKDWLPFMPTIVIVRLAPPPPPPGVGDGVGDGVVGLLLLPQLTATRAKADRATQPSINLRERAFMVFTSKGPGTGPVSELE